MSNVCDELLTRIGKNVVKKVGKGFFDIYAHLSTFSTKTKPHWSSNKRSIKFAEMERNCQILKAIVFAV